MSSCKFISQIIRDDILYDILAEYDTYLELKEIESVFDTNE